TAVWLGTDGDRRSHNGLLASVVRGKNSQCEFILTRCAFKERSMHPTDKAARTAGAIYLSMAFTAPLRLIYIPSTLFVHGDATATADNIIAHELLFRLGIAGDLLTGTIAIFLALALYRLFKAVDQNLAVLMVILGALMVTPIYFVNTLND